MIDYHIHTDHSGDGRTPVALQVEAAVAAGLSEICITSHFDHDAPTKGFLNFELDFDRYIADVLECAKQYQDQIRVKLGVEVGIQADKPHVIRVSQERIRRYPLDFVIVSTHFLPDADYHNPQRWVDNNLDKQDIQRRYLEHTLQYLESFDDFDVVAHLTYFSRFSPKIAKDDREMTYQDNAELYDRLFAILVGRGKGIEINTSMKSSHDLFMPDRSIAQRFFQAGGRIVTVGSDAHVPSQVGAYYVPALHMLQDAGFDSICTFDKRKPVFVNIEQSLLK